RRVTFGWGTAAGLVLNAPGLWAALKWVLDWKGRYDAGEGILNALSALPPWFYPLALVVGLLLIWFDARRPRREITVVFTPFAIAAAASIFAVGAWAYL